MKIATKSKILTLTTAIALSISSIAAYSAATYSEYQKGITVTSESHKKELLGDQYSETLLLGVASSFNIFMSGDFLANGSDCEGRIAAGGGANLGTATNYNVNKSDHTDGTVYTGADIILGTGPLINIDLANRTAVVPADISDEDIHYTVDQNGYYDGLSTAKIYRANLIDFEETYQYLDKVTEYLRQIEVNGTQSAGSWSGQIVFTGEDSETNVFSLTSEFMQEITEGRYAIAFDIPIGSTAVFNVSGDYVKLWHDNGYMIRGENGLIPMVGNDHPDCNRLLFNCYEAETIELTGSFYGSVLAPDATFISGEDVFGHISGQLIGESFDSGIEIGLTVFQGKIMPPR